MSNNQQQSHANNLKAARSSSFRNSARNIKKKTQAVANTASLMAFIEPFTDWLFGIALMLAIIKDIFDLVNNALIAIFAVGIPLIVIFTTIISLAIGFIMLLTGSSGKRKVAQRLAKRFLLLIGVSLAEIIPAVNLLPMETFIVIIIFWLTLRERKKNARAQKEEQLQTAPMNTAVPA